MKVSKLGWGGCLLLGLCVACGSDDSGTSGSTNTSTTSSSSSSVGGQSGVGGAGGTGGSVACGPDGPAPNEELEDTSDPTGGVFGMTEALEGLPEGDGPLRAIIETGEGTLTCTLYPDKAPNGVANFVGLARGRRPFKDPMSGKWVKRAFYDGLIFHRVIPGFVAQGGDPLGTGFGGPGYKFADEISDLKHTPGTLAYANSGPNSNGSQFYIGEVALPSLDGDYTTFGQCEPVSVVQALTGVATNSNDKPLTDLPMKRVTITRCPL